MAVESKRGCGYRKINGLYMVGGGIGVPCDRLPLALDVCPCCGQGIKQSLGWTWVDVAKLVQGPHLIHSKYTEYGQSMGEPDVVHSSDKPCLESEKCYFCGNPESMGKAGLLWVGGRFYPTPQDFIREGVQMGFSKRIKAVPRGFKVGQTYVLLAHPKAIPGGSYDTGLFEDDTDFPAKPGVFYIWLPSRIEKIMPESKRDSSEVQDLEDRGITPVFVPDDDKDHQGSVYDKPEEEPELD